MIRGLALALVASATAFLAVGPAAAQPPGGRGMRGGGGSDAIIALLENADVQKDLKLTDAEKGSIALLKDELREGDKKFRESTADLEPQERFAKMADRRKEVEKQIKEVFGDKAVRLKQIQRQQAGIASAFMFDRELGEAMKITEEQRNEFREFMMSQREAMQEIFQNEDQEARRKGMEEMQEKNKKKATEMLTADQKKKWEELIGTPVTYKLPSPMMGGRGGRGGPPPGEKGGDKKPPMV